jgi:Mg-chelatase subunit ChlD
MTDVIPKDKHASKDVDAKERTMSGRLHRMKKWKEAAAGTLLVAVMIAIVTAMVLPAGNAAASERPRIEVVFCLDTTGSMGGLIEGAKQKIWSIANGILSGEPTPDVYLGLVGYRDYGDAYVTRVFPLNGDLDEVFENLMSFRADGGGDTPEHVNRALHDAVHGISWSDNEETLKLIFLVGDCPPHTDYDDGYSYREACADAVCRNIVINTVQCGTYEETVAYWREIARLGEGRYAAVAQEGGMQVVETPFDAELAALNVLLEETVVPFGSDSRRIEYEDRRERVSALAPALAAERAACKSVDADMGSCDLLDALRSGGARLEDLKDRDLPPLLRGMSISERRSYISRVEEERADILRRIETLRVKRSAFIDRHLKEHAEEEGFDEVVQLFIEEQAARSGITYR